MADSSQLPVTTALEDLTPPSGLCGHLYLCAHTRTETYTYVYWTILNKILSDFFLRSSILYILLKKESISLFIQSIVSRLCIS